MWINISEKEAPQLSKKLEKAGFTDLATKVCEQLEQVNSPETAAYIKAAKELYEDNDCDIEVDEHPVISEGEGDDTIGGFVLAWVFVRFDEAAQHLK
jgi:hypothetical protein